jgi:hypothetical protein
MCSECIWLFIAIVAIGTAIGTLVSFAVWSLLSWAIEKIKE